jgi:proteasome lid subunit RPN8/RPN11
MKSTSSVPPISITRHAFCQIMTTVANRPAESGGILLGPIGSSDVTEFYFDSTAVVSAVTYSPDHVTLGRKLKEEWIPDQKDFKGFCHSHPGQFDRLSGGDLTYIRRLLEKNEDILAFPAPIVIPGEFRIRPIVVLRESPDIQRPTCFRII